MCVISRYFLHQANLLLCNFSKFLELKVKIFEKVVNTEDPELEIRKFANEGYRYIIAYSITDILYIGSIVGWYFQSAPTDTTKGVAISAFGVYIPVCLLLSPPVFFAYRYRFLKFLQTPVAAQGSQPANMQGLGGT